MNSSHASQPVTPPCPYEFKTVERPWGFYREYARNIPCTVWLVHMKPGECGSLQSHTRFDELWVFLSDGAQIQIGKETRRPVAGDEIFIPRGTVHRLSNLEGTRTIQILEVAFGTVLDEDKIRYEDKYGRR